MVHKCGVGAGIAPQIPTPSYETEACLQPRDAIYTVCPGPSRFTSSSMLPVWASWDGPVGGSPLGRTRTENGVRAERKNCP